MANWDDFVAADAPTGGADATASPPVNWDDFTPAPEPRFNPITQEERAAQTPYQFAPLPVRNLDITTPPQPEETIRPAPPISNWENFQRNTSVGRRLFGQPGAKEAGIGDSFTQQGDLGTLLSIPGRPFASAGRVAGAALGDISEAMRGDFGFENLRAAASDDTDLPIHKKIQAAAQEEKDRGEFGWPSVVAQGAVGLAELAPKILALGAGGGPALTGSVFGTEPDGTFSYRGGAMGMLIPGAAKITRDATTKAIDAGIKSGAEWLANPGVERLIHTAANQAAMNTVMAAADSNELSELYKSDPREFKRRIAEMMLSNLAFAVPEAMRAGPVEEALSVPGATRTRAEADAVARRAATPQPIDWQGFGPRPRPSVESPTIGVPPERPPVAYQFGSPTETRNEPAPINEPVPISPGGIGEIPPVSNAVEHEGRRYEKRGGVWFALDTPEGRPIFRNTENKKRLIADLELRLQGKEPRAIRQQSPNAEVLRATEAQVELQGVGERNAEPEIAPATQPVQAQQGATATEAPAEVVAADKGAAARLSELERKDNPTAADEAELKARKAASDEVGRKMLEDMRKEIEAANKPAVKSADELDAEAMAANEKLAPLFKAEKAARAELDKGEVTPKKQAERVKEVTAATKKLAAAIQETTEKMRLANEAKDAEDKLITDSLKGLADIFLPPPPPEGGPAPRGSGGPDTSRAVEHLKNLGRGIVMKGSRNFEAWSGEVTKLLGSLAERIQNLPALLRQAWDSLATEFPDLVKPAPGKFVAAKIVAERKAREARGEAPQQTPVLVIRGPKETPPEVPTTDDPKYQLGTYANSFVGEKNTANRSTWRSNLYRLWPGIEKADVRKIESGHILEWLRAMKAIEERQAGEKSVSAGEKRVVFDPVKRARDMLNNSMGVAALKLRGEGVVNTAAAVHLKHAGFKEGATLSKKVENPTQSQAQTILQSLSPRNQDLANFVYHVGVRIGEVLRRFGKDKSLPSYEGLRWSEVHLDDPNRTPWIDLSRKRTKVSDQPQGDKSFGLTQDAAEYLRDLKRKTNPASDSEEIFADFDNAAKERYNDEVRKAVKASGLNVEKGVDDEIHGSLFRKMFATRMNKSLGNLELVARMMGNSPDVIRDYYLLREPMSANDEIIWAAPRAFGSGKAATEPLGPEPQVGRGHAAVFRLNIPSDTPVRKVAGVNNPPSYLTTEIPTRSLVESDDVPQFKEITQPIKDRFDPSKGGSVIVWQRENGDMVIASGRHRVTAAKRDGVPLLNGIIIKESDGWTVDKVKLFDVVANMRDNQGSVRDYAKFFRNNPDAAKDPEIVGEPSILRADSNAHQGWIIGRDASDSLYSRWRADTDPATAKLREEALSESGETKAFVGDDEAAKIAALAPRNEGAQALAVEILDGGETLRLALKIVKDKLAELESGEIAPSAQQGGFGFEQTLRERLIAEAKAVERITNKLRTKITGLRSLVAVAQKDPAELEKYGYKTGRVEDVQADILKLQEELGRWSRWNRKGENEDLKNQVRAELGEKPKPVEPPKLKPADKETGDLLQGGDAPFNLTNEKGTDAERVAREKAEADEIARAKAEFEAKNQQDMFGGNKPPTPSRTAESEVTPMTREEATAAFSKRDAAGFTVEIITREEAMRMAPDQDAENWNGFFDHERRKIYVIHDAIKAGDVAEVARIVREEAAEGLLGTADGNRLLSGPDGLLAKAKLNLTEAEKAPLREAGYGEADLLREFISKSAAENRPWWKTAIEQVRVWLSKVGLANLTNAEVARLLVKQLRAMSERGESADTGGAFERFTPSRMTDEDAQRIYGRVMGIRQAGGLYTPENISAIQAKLRGSERYNFGPDTAVTPENTQRAFEAVTNLIDLPSAESELLKIRDVAPEQMAPGLLLSDLFRYGVKAMMGKQGDPSLVYFIAENYDRINIATGPMGPRGVGRALRALREGASDPTLVNLLQLFDAIEAAASTKLYGREKLGEIARIARDLEGGVPGELGKPNVLPQIEQKLRDQGLTPEIAWMLGLMKRYQEWNTEWVKPTYRASLLTEIKQLVQRFEREQPFSSTSQDNGQAFQTTLRRLLFEKAVESINLENSRREKYNETLQEGEQPKELIELDDDLKNLLQGQMRGLAREVWQRKMAAEADVTSKARNVEQRWAETALNNWEKEQTEWLKPEKFKGEAQKRIEEFMDLAPFSEDQRADEIRKLQANLESAGLLPNTAFQLAEAAWRRKLTAEANRKLRESDAAAKRIWNESEGVARSVLEKMRSLKIPVKDENAAREAIKRAMRLKPTADEIAAYGDVEASRRVDPVSNERYSQKLVDDLVEAGVEQGTAVQLAREIQLDRLFRWNTANARTMERAAGSKRIAGLMEELLAAPVLMQKSPQWRRDVARRWFEANGLGRADAIRATEVFSAEFDAQLEAAGVRLAEQIGRRENFTGERFRDFVAAIRAGMLDPTKPWSAKFAEAKGIRLPTPEEMKQLSELDAKLEDARVNGDERDMAEIASQMTSIYSKMHLPPDLMKIVAANVVATNLTGLRTLVVQGSPTVFTALDRVFATLAAPHRIGEIWMPVFRAMKGMMSEVGLALSKDAYTFVHNEMGPASNELKRLWEVGLDDVRSNSRARKAKGVVKMLYGSQQYFLRLLNAFDQASGVMVRESQLVLYGANQMRQAGFTTSEVADWVQATHQLKQAAYLTALGKGDSKVRAKVHADSLGAEMIRASLQEKLVEKAGDIRSVTMANQAWKAAENDAYSVLGRRGKDISERDEGGFFSRYAFLHTLLDVSSKLRSGDSQARILAVTLLGYLNVPIRTARFYAWNSPYGLIRMGIHHGRRVHHQKKYGTDYYESDRNWWKQSLSNEYQANHRLKNALAATAVQAVLTAAGIAYFGQSSSEVDTKKDNQIFVTGDGPKNAALRDAWLKAGFRPNSVVMFAGGKPATVPFTRLGEAMGHMFVILAARDDYNWRKKERLASGKPFKETWEETGGYFLGGYASMLMGRGPLATVSRWARAGGSEGGAKAALASGLAGVAASSTMPYLGSQRTIRDVAMGRVDTSSVSSAMAANFPVLGAFQNRAVNRFGDPLGNRAWSAIVGEAGGVVSIQVEDNTQNRKLYQALVKKGVFPPMLRRGALEEKYGEMTNEDFGTFAKRSGDMLKKATLTNLSVIEKQTPEEAKKTLSKLATSADNVAAKGLGLEPVASARSSGGGMSLPAASGSSSGLLGGSGSLLSGSGGFLGGAGLLGGGRAAGGSSGTRRPRAASGSRGTLLGGRSRRLTLRSRRPRLSLRNRRLTTRLRRPAMRRRRLSLV